MTDRTFADRHIGTSPADQDAMLKAVGLPSLEALMDACMPELIRSRDGLALPAAVSETQAQAELRALAKLNRPKRSMIGFGYHGTHTPAVIRRNVLENPSWYTAYTPYQAEISQGRLEALLNFQTVVADLTGLPVAGASLLDEATAAAEAMLLARRAAKKFTGDVFAVDSRVLPQTLAVLRTRAEPVGIELVVADLATAPIPEGAFGVLLQYPGADGAVRAGVLEEDAEGALGDRGGGEVGDDEFDADRFGPGPQDREGLREDARVDGEDVTGEFLGGAAGQEHRFGGGGGLVEEARSGDGQAGEVGDDGLEVQERLEAPLGDLGLVGRVRGVPGGVLQDVAADDRGRVGAVVAEADHGPLRPVQFGEGPEFGLGLGLRDGGGEGQAVAGADQLGHAGVHERFEAGQAHGLEHGVLVGGAGADVAVGEGAVGHGDSPVTGRRQLRSPRLSPAAR
jgi:hypothetical protein